MKPLCSLCSANESATGSTYCLECDRLFSGTLRKQRSEEERKRHNARTYANVYERRGQLAKRLECEVCGTTEGVEKHHPDYSQPLVVVYVCKAHHPMADKIRRAGERWLA